MYEVEVKAKLRNKEMVMKKLESFGCKFGEVLHQIDHVYFPEGFVFPPPISTAVLRVREQNEKYFLTLKISQSGRQDSIERELQISDGKMMMEIIKLLKYQEAPTVDKKRIKTKFKDMTIELDEVKELGEFIEVEKIVTNENPEERKAIQKELADFIETLGVAKEDLMVNAKYDIMLFEKQNSK
jgi:adenylate cyclase class 2